MRNSIPVSTSSSLPTSIKSLYPARVYNWAGEMMSEFSKTVVHTYWATIYIGFKNVDTGKVHNINKARNVCSDYVNKIGLCVTLTPTEYVYSSDRNEIRGEIGAMVGLINNPRFPVEPEVIEERAIGLAEILKEKLEQHRVTIQFPDKTIMLSDV